MNHSQNFVEKWTQNDLEKHKDNIVKFMFKIQDKNYTRRQLKDKLRNFGSIETSGNFQHQMLKLAQKLATQSGKLVVS